MRSMCNECELAGTETVLCATCRRGRIRPLNSTTAFERLLASVPAPVRREKVRAVYVLSPTGWCLLLAGVLYLFLAFCYWGQHGA